MLERMLECDLMAFLAESVVMEPDDDDCGTYDMISISTASLSHPEHVV